MIPHVWALASRMVKNVEMLRCDSINLIKQKAQSSESILSIDKLQALIPDPDIESIWSRLPFSDLVYVDRD